MCLWSSGVSEFPVIVKAKKTCLVSTMFRFLSSKNDPGIKKKKILNYSFKIGVELP